MAEAVGDMRNFVKKKEDFVCDVCGKKVIGTGYTNHCPDCLWSKHVDEQTPGDRVAGCKGLMEPVGIEREKGELLLIHRCQTCGTKTRNKTAKEDSLEEILKIFR